MKAKSLILKIISISFQMSHSKIPIIRRMESNNSDAGGPDSNNSSNNEAFKSASGYNNTQYMKGLSPNINASPSFYRHTMHRPSVRSISETPNVIGAVASHYNNDICSIILTGLSWFLVVVFFPISFAFLFRVVQEYERGDS